MKEKSVNLYNKNGKNEAEKKTSELEITYSVPKNIKKTTSSIYFEQANRTKKYYESKRACEIELKEKYIFENLFLVVKIAYKLLSDNPTCNISIQDLIAVGNEALVTSAIHFNPNVGAKFTTYSYIVIKNFMIHYICDNFPIRLKKGYKNLKLDEKISYESFDGNKHFSDDIADDSTQELSERIELEKREERLINFIDNMSNRDKIILCSPYGCLGIPKMKAKHVAEILGITINNLYKLRSKLIKQVLEKFEKKK